MINFESRPGDCFREVGGVMVIFYMLRILTIDCASSSYLKTMKEGENEMYDVP